jgi:hypothetical protein
MSSIDLRPRAPRTPAAIADHPFGDLPYLGLGLLDPTSIRHDREDDAWSADYPDQWGQPCLQVSIGSRGVDIVGLAPDGTRECSARGTSLGIAVQHYGLGVLGGDIPSFWERVGPRVQSIWLLISGAREHLMSFCPAVGIAEVRIPTPVREPWAEPGPTPIELRLGLAPMRDPIGPRHGSLLRWYADEPDVPRIARVRVRQYAMPAILLPDFSVALKAAMGPLSAIEWRPIGWTQPTLRLGQAWDVPEDWQERPDGRLIRYALVEDDLDPDELTELRRRHLDELEADTDADPGDPALLH